MRRNGNAAFVHPMLVYALVMICFSGGVGLGTVWLRQKISVVANRSKVIEGRIADAERRLSQMAADVETAQGPDMLKLRNQTWRLGLVPPQETQIDRVSEDPVLRLAGKRTSSIFSEAGSIPPGIRLTATQ